MAGLPASPLLYDHLNRCRGDFNVSAFARLSDSIGIALVRVGRDRTEPESRRIALEDDHGSGRSHLELVPCWNVDGVDSCNNRVTEAWSFGISV